MVEKKISSIKLLENKGVRYVQTVGVNIGSIILFGGIGWMLDSRLGTKPLFFIMLFIASFPFSIYILYKKYVKLAGREAENTAMTSQRSVKKDAKK